MLSSPHEANFACGRAIIVGYEGRTIDSSLGQFAGDHPAIGVVSNDTCQGDFGFKAAQHVCDVGRAAQARFLFVFTQQDDGSFLADSLRITPDITIKDQVPQNKDARGPEPFHFIDQFVRHCVCRPWPATGGSFER